MQKWIRHPYQIGAFDGQGWKPRKIDQILD